MRPHEASPGQPNAHPAPPRALEERTSPWYIALWFLVALTVAYFGLRTYVGAILTAAMTNVPGGTGTAVLWTMVLIALVGIPLNLWHLVLVCTRRRSTARTVLLVVQAVFVLVFFAVGWALIMAGSHYGMAN